LASHNLSGGNFPDDNMKTRYTLVGFEIEGEWNVPLLVNAAEMSGASLLLAESRIPFSATGIVNGSMVGIDEVLNQFDQVLACETTVKSRPVYEFAMPRGHVGLIVGNERNGIPGKLLKRVHQVISIPMLGKGSSSVNVAVAAAIILYVAERDLGRKRLRSVALTHRDVDVLVFGPSDPSELGSFLRSAWAFGWQRVFLSDPGGAWFTNDRQTILAGRAAARNEVNRLVVCPREQLNFGDYDQIVVCDKTRSGDPLSRFALRNQGKVLLVYGDADESLDAGESVQQIYVDHAATTVDPCFRHAGSILLSVVSQQLRRGRRG
jgi:tRNA(Leu) C34 or U34 (ribose-2'-O)-methylase TrmL